MALGVGTFDDDLKSLGNARFLTALLPKVIDGLFEGEANADFTLGVTVNVGDADFLLLAAAFVNQKNGVAQFKFRLQGDEGAAGIDKNGFGVFVERAIFAGKPINDDGYAHGDALARARGFLCRDSGERNGIRFGGFWRG